MAVPNEQELYPFLLCQVLLTHFLIQNYVEIFEDDSTSVRRVSSPSSHNSFGESALNSTTLAESDNSLGESSLT